MEKNRNILVAGYVNKGENAEETIQREMKEEIGRDIISYQYLKSSYYEKNKYAYVELCCCFG